MVKYITTENNGNNVDELMDCVNNYLIFQVEDGISSSAFTFNRKARMQNMIEYLNNINEFYKIDTNKNIASHRKYIGGILVFVKKVIRKLCKWYINSVFDQQSTYNASVTRYLNELTVIVKELSEENIIIKKKNIELEIELRNLKGEN